MYKSKTVFVVGAGASKEVKFPIGNELLKVIKRLSDNDFDNERRINDQDFFRCLNIHFGPNNPKLYSVLRTGKQMLQGLDLSISIDNYIDAHKDNSEFTLFAKMAIAFAILKAEENSPLYIDRFTSRQINFEALKKTWYLPFAQLLFQQVRSDQLRNIFNDISIVCFNYDRCIEHFLTHALVAYYSISYKEAQDTIANLKIFHPYGKLDNLPIEDDLPIERHPNGVSFGQNTDHIDILNVSKNIKTYTEQIEELEVLNSIREEVSQAETIVFLGFGFHPDNMRLLTPDNSSKVKQVFATALNISDYDVGALKERIRATFKMRGVWDRYDNEDDMQVRNDLSCLELFNNYRYTLTVN